MRSYRCKIFAFVFGRRFQRPVIVFSFYPQNAQRIDVAFCQHFFEPVRNIADAFARVENGQMLLYGCDIQPWETAGEFFQHKARRPRRLLLHKREIFKLEQQVSQKGCSLVALKLYWKNGKVKLALGLGKGKTHRDQRYDLKARVEMREAQREVARINRR